MLDWDKYFYGQSSAFIKILRADDQCFFDCYLSAIIQMIDDPHDYVPRPSPKNSYTVFGDRIVRRSEKTPLYTAIQKQGFAPHNSTTMVTPTAQSPTFSSHTNLNVGIIFPRKDVLPNRYFLHDGWTTCRAYDHHSHEEALEFFNKYCAPSGSRQRLFSDEESFKEAILTSNDSYNEVLAYTRFSSDCCVVMASDNQESRWVAIHYAHELARRLQKQMQQVSQEHHPDPVVRIFYYLPNNPKHFVEYSESQQREDISEAKAIAKDKEKVSEKIKIRSDFFSQDEGNASEEEVKNDYSFLLVLDDEEGGKLLENIFYSDIGVDLINNLVDEKYFYHLDTLSERIKYDWLLSAKNEVKVKYLKWCIEHGKTNKAIRFLQKYPVSLSRKVSTDLLCSAMEFNRVKISELLVNREDVNINAINPNYKTTVLYETIFCERIDILCILLTRKDIDVNAKSGLGQETALMIAVRRCSVEMVKALLLVPGINLDVKNLEGKTAKDIAIESNQPEIADILLNPGKCLMTLFRKRDTETVEESVSRNKMVL